MLRAYAFSPLVHLVQQHQLNDGAPAQVNFVDPSGPMVVIRNATPEYQDLSRILQQLHSLAYASSGSTPRFSSGDGSPVGLMAN